MKTYESFFDEFLSEAPTEAQAAKMAPGMSPEKRRAALERNARNQAKRDTPTTPADQVRRQPQKRLMPSGSSSALTKSKGSSLSPSSSSSKQSSSALSTRAADKGSALSKRAADKGSAIVRHRNELKKDAKQKLASGTAGQPKLSPRKPPNPSKKSVGTKDPKGFMGGLKSSLGGDAFSKDKKERLAAREKAGRAVGKAIKSTPGKAVGAAKKLGKAVLGAKSDSLGSSSGDNIGGNETRDYGKSQY